MATQAYLQRFQRVWSFYIRHAWTGPSISLFSKTGESGASACLASSLSSCISLCTTSTSTLYTNPFNMDAPVSHKQAFLSRDAASAELESGALDEAQAACSRVSQLGERPDIYGPLAQRLQLVADWLRQRASVGLKDQGRDFYEGVWSGQQVHVLTKHLCLAHFCVLP